MVLVTVKKMRFSVEKIISLRGISDIKNGQKSGNDDSNIASKGGKCFDNTFRTIQKST